MNLTGIDVSNANGAVNWGKVKASGANFAYIRASFGGFHQDLRFAENWAGAKAAGLKRGAYHVLHPDQDPVPQADLFSALCADAELAPVLDAEWIPQGQGLPERWSTLKDPEACEQMMTAFLTRVLSKHGKQPWIYIGRAFASQFLPMDHCLGIYKLWVPHYAAAIGLHDVPAGWASWAAWQSGQANVAGCTGKVDVSQLKVEAL